MTSHVRREGDQLIASRTLAAERSLVWRAFTAPEHLAAFWGGHHATVAEDSVTVDLQEGGGFGLDSLGVDGAGRRLRFVYEIIDEPSLLVFSEPSTGIITSVRLEPTTEGTVVTVHQRRLPAELQTDQAASGLAGILEQLDALLGQIRDTTRGLR